MKTFRNLGMAVVAVLMCVCYACSSGGDEPEFPTPDKPVGPQEPKKVTVSINVKDIVSVQEMPIDSRTDEPAYNDLYLLLVQTITTESTTNYAYGLFDLSKPINITLVEGDTYKINAVAVKDGKSKIFVGEDGLYGPPFRAKLTNEFDYVSTYEFIPAKFALADVKKGELTPIAVGLELYFGQNFSFVASDDITSIHVEFFRIHAIQTEFHAVDMPKGFLGVHIEATNESNETYTTNPAIIVNSVNEPASEFITFDDGYYDGLYSNNDGLECTFKFLWQKESGQRPIELPSAKIKVKADKKYIIKVKVDHSTSPEVQIAPLEDYDFNTTETYNVSMGVVEKETGTQS